MAIRLGETIHRLDALRIEPSPKRIRARLGGRTISDTDRAMLVWEPRRVTPVYAVPVADLEVGLRPMVTPAAPDLAGSAPVWDPSVPFSVRLTPGRAVTVVAGGSAASGFLPDDPDLDGYVVLDFDGFVWLEDDDEIVSHPHDPFSRIDIRESGAEFVLSRDGVTIARSRRVRILYETALPPRLYWPPEDVAIPLEPSMTRSTCAYKGTAEYLTARVGGRELTDIAWTYREPLIDGEGVRGRVAFFEERLDLDIDGRRRDRRESPFG